MHEQVSDRVKNEGSVMRKYGLRWAVLAAWCDEVYRHGGRLSADAARLLESSRIKISSGCFSTCEVGCDLGHLEAALVSAAASMPDEHVDFWIDLLGHSMTRELDVQRLLRIPAVELHYSNCGLLPCKCSS